MIHVTPHGCATEVTGRKPSSKGADLRSRAPSSEWVTLICFMLIS